MATIGSSGSNFSVTFANTQKIDSLASAREALNKADAAIEKTQAESFSQIGSPSTSKLSASERAAQDHADVASYFKESNRQTSELAGKLDLGTNRNNDGVLELNQDDLKAKMKGAKLGDDKWGKYLTTLTSSIEQYAGDKVPAAARDYNTANLASARSLLHGFVQVSDKMTVATEGSGSAWSKLKTMGSVVLDLARLQSEGKSSLKSLGEMRHNLLTRTGVSPDELYG